MTKLMCDRAKKAFKTVWLAKVQRVQNLLVDSYNSALPRTCLLEVAGRSIVKCVKPDNSTRQNESCELIDQRR